MVFPFFFFMATSQDLTFPNHTSSQALRIVEHNMSTLNLSESLAPLTEKPPKEAKASGGIGARIMRQIRRNNETTPKKTSDSLQKKNLSSKAIEKLYLKKTLGRLKQTQLETIFELEEETDAGENATNIKTQLFGKTKVKRSLSCKDGFNVSKTLKEKRKRRIKKIFGVYKKIKSISKKTFEERLHATESVNLIPPSQIANV